VDLYKEIAAGNYTLDEDNLRHIIDIPRHKYRIEDLVQTPMRYNKGRPNDAAGSGVVTLVTYDAERKKWMYNIYQKVNNATVKNMPEDLVSQDIAELLLLSPDQSTKKRSNSSRSASKSQASVLTLFFNMPYMYTCYNIKHKIVVFKKKQ
jgi:hypothetical protein